jgi:predicted acetyltransferase
MDIEIRPIRAEEFVEHALALEAAFHGAPRLDEIEEFRGVAELDRCFAAVDGSEIVGGAVTNSFRMAVPGGVLPTAAVTGVGVKPTHRRMGVNTALMRRQLDDAHDRGEPAAILFASEGGIYGRYGYGLGTFGCDMDLETDRSEYVRGYTPTGRVRLLDREEALPLMHSVYDRVWRGRPGMIELNERWFRHATYVPEHERAERPCFYAVHATGQAVDAYAIYRVKHEWPGGIPSNELELLDIQATTPQAYADMWRYVLDADLVRHVTSWNRPVDEPLLHLLREPRRLRLRVQDALWVRLVDVAEALQGRRYAARGRLTFEVDDRFCPWNQGRYELVGGPDGAECRPTDGEPDLVCTVNDLGATYLGGSTFRQLHRAGHIEEEHPGALALADAMFASDPAPWSSHLF